MVTPQHYSYLLETKGCGLVANSALIWQKGLYLPLGFRVLAEITTMIDRTDNGDIYKCYYTPLLQVMENIQSHSKNIAKYT